MATLARHSEAAPAGWARAVAVVGVPAAIVWTAAYLSLADWFLANPGWDFSHYIEGARAWMATGSPYTAESLAGPVAASPETMPFLHPPLALPLLAAFTVLPWILWWAIPLGVLGWCLWTWRPGGWALVGVIACAAYPRSIEIVAVGNTDMWAAAGVAAGLRFGWPAALVLLKPSSFLFALVGARDRSWWVTVGVLGLAAVPFGGLWVEWITVVRNVASEAGYLFQAVPLMMLPIVAWASRGSAPARRG